MRPAQPASKRGVSRQFDLKNLVEIFAASELIGVGVRGELVADAMGKLREVWPTLANKETRSERPILALVRLSGMPMQPVSPMLLSIPSVGEQCSYGYTILGAVSVGYIINMIEKHFGDGIFA